ncbi:NFX1-type zinc finger-containing protein 1 [Bulinus truncatus]|nr:NFX1-type zinc finger-containing protein 1 [Bulinus truncatus]
MDIYKDRRSIVNEGEGEYKKQPSHPVGKYQASLSNLPRGRERDTVVKQKYFNSKPPGPLKESDLQEWAGNTDAGHLILMMCNQLSEFELYLKSPYKENGIELLVRSVFFAISAHHHKASIRKLMETVCASNLLDIHLNRYLIDKQMSQTNWTDARDFILSVLEIIKTIVAMVPNVATKCVVALYRLKVAASSVSDVCEDEELLETITQTLARTKEVFKIGKEKEEATLIGCMEKADNDQQPPDDFRSISVIPTIEDLKEDTRPFLRCAIINGEYENALTYLDIQFRLMKQDFILPLRHSINQFKACGCKQNFSSSDVRVYFKVRIIGGAYKDDGLNHVLQFDVSGLKSVKWDFSKRLIYGSHLCLSKDKFETALFATVADHDRDSSILAQGFITVNFKSNLDLVFNASPLDEYIMVESVVFFESYIHVLKGLQEISSELPLSEYIVRCKKTIKPPKYLLPCGVPLKVPMYDLSCLMNNRQNSVVPVLTTTKWPGAEEMCLNHSQRQAVVSTLTKELALIQGPPGTGKTFVGLKIMEILLTNQDNIYEDKVKPILVVCYTNHALDQFLEGVLKFCPEGIVRVGGKSSSETLANFNINKLKRENKDSSATLKTSRSQCIYELKNVSKEITNIQSILHSLDYDAVSEHTLKRLMRPEHFDSLKRSKRSTQLIHIREWLNAPKIPTMVALTKMINNYLSCKILETAVSLKRKPILTRHMNVIDRTILYKIITNSYKEDLYKRKQFLLRQTKNSKNVKELESIDIEFENLKTMLPTCRYKIKQIFQCQFLNKINELYGKDIWSSKDGPIKYWLLGQDRSLHCLLDDIETLRKYASGRYSHTETIDDREGVQLAEASRILDGEDAREGDYVSQLTKARSNIVTLVKRVESLGITEDYMDDFTAQSARYPASQSTFRDFRDKLQSAPVMNKDEVEATVDLWSLSMEKRFSLYKRWVAIYKLHLTKKMNNLADQYSELFQRKTEASEEENLMILKKAKVIGMTTTGAAIHRSALQALRCRIILVEEAAEVLESHIITSLNKHCSHLILIGDHQQLRPSPAVYELAKEFKLDISLFERLVKNGLPHTVLQKQHRMRPEISKLMKHIYPDLQDHESVKSYDHVRGMSKDVFFICHQEIEQHDEESQSKTNAHESQYVVELCKYLLLKGYEASQITILTTYSGQVYLIRKTMRERQLVDPVRVTSVDNFQGEENDIILLSLVRSNEDNKAGFIKVNNRICVALSRAKKGLYAIGNFDMLSAQSKLWHKIVETFHKDNLIGDFLPVECQNHSDCKQLIQTKSDFKKCPEGGSGQDCMYRLDCGHVCELRCHGYDTEHRTFKCRKSCIRQCPAGHPCKLKCFDPCQCRVLVDKSVPRCGHLNKMLCYIPPEDAKCSQACTVTLECGHLCSGRCGSCNEKKKHKEKNPPKTASSSGIQASPNSGTLHRNIHAVPTSESGNQIHHSNTNGIAVIEYENQNKESTHCNIEDASDIQDIDISKPKSKTESHFVSFLLKTVFLLNEIDYIDDEACGVIPSVDRMRTALNKVKQNGRVTEQQEREFKQELWRCLNLACLTQLEWLLEQEQWPHTKRVIESIQMLQISKTDPETLD